MKIKALYMKENGKYKTLPEREVEAAEKEDIRQISLMAGEILPAIREINGLCTKRFGADIETEGLDYASLSVGDYLIFDDVCLQITGTGKRCFDDCPIRQNGQICELTSHVAFARIVRNGRLKVHASGTKALEI